MIYPAFFSPSSFLLRTQSPLLLSLICSLFIDTMNYYKIRDGAFPELDNGSTTESELVASLAKGAKVVKAFNNIMYFDMLKGTPKGTPNRRALTMAGDDAEAKKLVGGFIDECGFDVVDLGPLKEGRHVQPSTLSPRPLTFPLYFNPIPSPPSLALFHRTTL